MKKFTFLFFLCIAATTLFAQDYQISFAGSGSATNVETVNVQNLTQGTNLTLNGSDILHLVASVGLESINSEHSGALIYPNPAAGKCTFDVHLSSRCNLTIEILDITGKTISFYIGTHNAGNHLFNGNNLGNGVYIIRIITDDFNYSSLLVSHGESTENVGISYLSTNEASLPVVKTGAAKSLVPMQYNEGDMLLFQGTSGVYSTVSTLVPTQSTTVTYNFVPASDVNGNNYATVTIGSQVWMAENLRSTSNENSVPIVLVTDSLTWAGLTTPAYCWYKNDQITYGNTYGALYNWYAVGTGQLCPGGWHEPTDTEWVVLADYLGGEVGAAFKLKETGTVHWGLPNDSVTNETGFTALPGGSRGTNGAFADEGAQGFWWSATTFQYDSTAAKMRDMAYWGGTLGVASYYKKSGFSVRCIKD